MIIKDVYIRYHNDTITLSANCKLRKIGWDNVYFSVNACHKTYVYEDASPFAAALLLPAMKQGEDLIIHGSISNQLYEGMQKIMAIVDSWHIGLRPITIKADQLTEDHQPKRGTATFFSGGVDSFYTYLKHKQDPNPDYRVTSLLFVNNNFDVNPNNTRLWEITKQRITDIAEEEGIEPVFITSNIHSLNLLNPILSWDYIHGSCLAATGLFLRNGFSRIYIPSTRSAEQQIPWGSSLELDGHWSTEKVTFIYDGSEVTRVEKVRTQLAASPLALKHLRVCYMNKKGAYNCGQCDKCLRTMINLYIAGVLDQAQTFPHEINLELLAQTATAKHHEHQVFNIENLEALRAISLNPDMQKVLASSIARSHQVRQNRVTKVRERIAYLDHQYSKGLIYKAYSGVHDRILP